MRRPPISTFFFFNDTATTEIYTLSLHDALPIWQFNQAAQGHVGEKNRVESANLQVRAAVSHDESRQNVPIRSEEHTSELQSQSNLVCRLLLEKKKTETDIGLSNHIYVTSRVCRE